MYIQLVDDIYTHIYIYIYIYIYIISSLKYAKSTDDFQEQMKEDISSVNSSHENICSIFIPLIS